MDNHDSYSPSFENPDSNIQLWATKRPEPWKFAGWTPRESTDPGTYGDFEKRLSDGIKSDHGETREADIYDQGAVFWYKEKGV